ncbi:hypothetical protein ACLESO_18035 [Pyxidicoccus sp. 3LG]
MDYRKLFQVLVVGGAMVGGAAGCGDDETSAQVTDAGTNAGDSGTQGDGGTKVPDAGGGVPGW